MRDARRPTLQEGDLAGEVLRLLLVRHLVHLVRYLLEPRLGRFAERDHQRELLADRSL